MIFSCSPHFEGIEDEEHLRILNSCSRLVLSQKLNEPSTLTFEFTDNLAVKSILMGNPPVFPSSVTLNSKTGLSSSEGDAKETLLFFGFPSKFQRIGKSNTLALSFVDPLIGSFQHGNPHNWADKQKVSLILKDVLKTFLKDDSSGLTLKALMKPEHDFEVQTALSDFGMTKYEFLTHILRDKYGLNFFYAHDLSPKGQIVFFKPEVHPSQFATLPLASVFGRQADFLMDFNAAFDQVDVQGQEQEHSAFLDQIQDKLSPTSKAILKNRASMGLRFERQNIFPNESLSTCKDLAENQIISGALNTHSLHFECQEYLTLGSYLKIDSKDSPFSAFLEGYYLITEVERTKTKTHWTHKYKGVRS